jgi:hypothetical protein
MDWKKIGIDMLVCAAVGAPFGVWQDSAVAGIFMALFVVVMAPRF